MSTDFAVSEGAITIIQSESLKYLRRLESNPNLNFKGCCCQQSSDLFIL